MYKYYCTGSFGEGGNAILGSWEDQHTTPYNADRGQPTCRFQLTSVVLYMLVHRFFCKFGQPQRGRSGVSFLMS
jgi:hypothetical protein